MIYSTTAVTAQQSFADAGAIIKHHLGHLFLGIIALLLSYCVNPFFYHRHSQWLLIVSLVLLSLVLIPGVGHVSGGARRWLTLGPLRLQPSELVKMMLICYFASYIGRHQEKLRNFLPGSLLPFSIVSIFALLLLLEPDFGTTVVIFLVVFAQFFTVSRMKHLFLIALVGLTSVVSLIVISPYRFRRFQMFLDPFQDPSNSGYQLIQSLIAVGSGGITGTGLGAGKQKLFYLPAAHTDFIYAVIAEELGLIGAAFIIFLFLLIAFRGITVSRRLEKNVYLSTLSLGITLLLVIPALLNVSVVLGLLPTKGMVLPFIAYGGTATVVNLMLMGVLLRLSRIELS